MGNKRTTKTKDITLPKLREPEFCFFCKKTLPKRHVIHKNIHQDIPIHKFCSRDCKNEYCAEIVAKIKEEKENKNKK